MVFIRIGVVILTPEKKPTPSAMIANIAKKRPKDPFISRKMVLFKDFLRVRVFIFFQIIVSITIQYLLYLRGPDSDIPSQCGRFLP